MILAAVLAAVATPSRAADGAFADARSSPARGTEACFVRQLISPHLKALRQSELEQFGMSTVAFTSEVQFKIGAGGSVSIAASADTYPGSRFYALVGGERVSGGVDDWIPLSGSQVAALEREEPFAYSYTNWPWGSEINGQDAFAGFARAKAECVRFLGGG